MLVGGVEVEVDLSHNRAIAAMGRGVETIAAEIQATVFTVRRVVAVRILIEDGENRGVGPDAQGIDLLHLAGSKSEDLGWVVRSASACRIVAGAESEPARAKGVGGNGAELRDTAGVLALFVVEEIEDAVGDDLSAGA